MRVGFLQGLDCDRDRLMTRQHYAGPARCKFLAFEHDMALTDDERQLSGRVDSLEMFEFLASTGDMQCIDARHRVSLGARNHALETLDLECRSARGDNQRWVLAGR